MAKKTSTIRRVMDEHPDVKAIYPIHMNPAVRETANEYLGNDDRIHIIEPLDVLDFHNFLSRSYLILWRKRFWCTEKLNKWLDDFKPECVFLAFSDDYFIPQIAMYAAKRYNVPIVSCIGDDYYFNAEKTLNPIYLLYKSTYKKLIDKVLAWPGSAIYISDKIRDKYNSEFGLDGETVYLTSTVQRKPFSVINKDCPVITYFGNIGMGRNNSLNDIGYALGKINSEYMLEVYSNEKDEQVYSVFKDNPNVRYMGSVPYTQVQKRMQESNITVIVEGFEKKRYQPFALFAVNESCGCIDQWSSHSHIWFFRKWHH